MPSEEEPISDQKRILLKLKARGYENVIISLSVLRIIYPMCRDVDFDITVTLLYREMEWVAVNGEAGDQRQKHYGLAVD